MTLSFTFATIESKDCKLINFMNKSKAKLIEKAIEIALFVHSGKVDKAGAPYILHPLRLMMQMQTDEQKMIAVMHDVVEDGKKKGVDLEYLRKAGFPKVVLENVKALTHNKDVNLYEEYVEKIRSFPIARIVKLADLYDNMNIKRIPHPKKDDFDRVEKYKRAVTLLKKDLT